MPKLSSPTDSLNEANFSPSTRFLIPLSGPDNVDYKTLAGGRVTAGASGLYTDSSSTHIGHGIHEPDRNYEFHGSISEDMLHRYLDRAINMQGMSNAFDEFPTSPERDDNLSMLINIGAKFVGRMGYLWGEEYYFNANLHQISMDTASLHSHDAQIICEAAILEEITASVNGIAIELYVKLAFGYNDVTYPHTHFNIANIAYTEFLYPDKIPRTYSGQPLSEILTSLSGTPDISKIQTRMWFYFLATKYIDNGIEALHMGQVGLMIYNDPGTNHFYWELLSLIRTYARTHARRGVILLNSGVYYYDPFYPVLASGFERQLLFDFHGNGIVFSKYTAGPFCVDYTEAASYQPVSLDPATESNTDRDLINESTGGRHPQGWLCAHTPYFLEFDNWTSYELGNIGCNASEGSWRVGNYYGFDCITYFAMQDAPHRNLLLVYLNYKLKCLDPYGQIEMPGRRNMAVPPGVARFSDPHTVPYYNPAHDGRCRYRANTSAFGQEETIKNLWNGFYSIGVPRDWVPYNFTTMNVSDPERGMQAADGLVFAGADKIYYIGTDGRIYAYIKVGGNEFGGVWLTTSPTWVADGNGQHGQVAARSDLVASPGGNALLYIGIDGFIHGFNIIDVWTYEYFDFVKDGPSGMLAAGKRARCCLIHPTGYSVYFITTDGWVFGYVYSAGAWQLASPTVASVLSYGLPAGYADVHAAGGLTYDSLTRRLYFVNTGGLLYYYTINPANVFDCKYFACPGNAQLSANNVRISGGMAISNTGGRQKIYFTGNYSWPLRPEGPNWIYCLTDTGSGWELTSPSYIAAAHGQPFWGTGAQVPPPFGAQVAVSPDGRIIAYMAVDLSIVYYIFNGTEYQFAQMIPLADSPISIQFTADNELFYIARINKMVHRYKFQEAYCRNGAIDAIEQTH